MQSADGFTGSGTVRLGFLVGDVNQSRVVTVSDLGQLVAVLAQVVNASNFQFDVNANGTLTIADKAIGHREPGAFAAGAVATRRNRRTRRARPIWLGVVHFGNL